MSIKKAFLLIVVVVLAIGIGCAGEDQSRFSGDKFNIGKSLGVGGGKCLEDFGGTISRFLDSSIGADELAGFYGCIDNALKLFSTYVRGSKPGEYSDQELRTYLQTYFMKDSKISDELLAGIMSLKKLFVGGSESNLTKAEVKEARNFINMISGMSYRALPYMQIYTSGIGKEGGEIKHLPERQVKAAVEFFGVILEDLAFWLTRKESQFEIPKLINFLNALKESMTPEEAKNMEELISMVPLAQSAKVILMGGTKDDIGPNQWKHFFELLNKSFGILIKYNYYIKDEIDWLKSERFAHLRDIATTVFSMITMGIDVHPGKTIPHILMADFIDRIGALISFPLGLESSTIFKLWTALVDFGLKPLADDKDEAKPKGLGEGQFRVLEFEFYYWFAAQDYLNSLFISNYEFGSYNKLKDGERDKAVSEIQRVVDGKIPLITDEMGRLHLDSTRTDLSYDFDSLFALNWQRAAIRLLIRGFSNSKEARQKITGLTEEELATAASSLKDLLVALGVSSENDTPESIAASIFQLASLFMPRSQGKNILSLEEAVEYFSVVLSGVNLGEPFSVDIKNLCENLSAEGEDEAYSVDCYRQVLTGGFGKYLESMPSLAEYYLGLDDNTRDLFHSSLESAGRNGGFSNDPITKSEMNKVFVVLHYVEIYMWRFDSNRNGAVNKDEALAGFSVFKSVLKMLIKDQSGIGSGTLAKGLYAWLLAKGSVPTSKSEFVDFALWSVMPWQWKSINADRTRLAQILGALSAAQRD